MPCFGTLRFGSIGREQQTRYNGTEISFLFDQGSPDLEVHLLDVLYTASS
jgi:hypothetical protein